MGKKRNQKSNGTIVIQHANNKHTQVRVYKDTQVLPVHKFEYFIKLFVSQDSYLQELSHFQGIIIPPLFAHAVLQMHQEKSEKSCIINTCM